MDHQEALSSAELLEKLAGSDTMQFDEERGLDYFLRMRDSIARTYIENYGYDDEKADEVATRIAMKLLIRNVGPENAERVFNIARKKGIIK